MFKPISRKYFSNVTWSWYAWNDVYVFKALCGIGFVLHTYYQCSLKKYFRYPITFLKYTLLKKSRGEDKTYLDSWPIIYFSKTKSSMENRMQCLQFLRRDDVYFGGKVSDNRQWLTHKHTTVLLIENSSSIYALSQYYSPGARNCFPSPAGFF